MKTKIAPALREFLDDPDSRPRTKIAAARDLRALLAVARVAIEEDAGDREAFPKTTPAPGSLVARKRRALSRLSRASVPRGKRP